VYIQKFNNSRNSSKKKKQKRISIFFSKLFLIYHLQ